MRVEDLTCENDEICGMVMPHLDHVRLVIYYRSSRGRRGKRLRDTCFSPYFSFVAEGLDLIAMVVISPRCWLKAWLADMGSLLRIFI